MRRILAQPETTPPTYIDQRFEIATDLGRVVGAGHTKRVLFEADTGVRLLRIVQQVDAQGNQLAPEIFDGTEFDIRSFFSMGRSHETLNRRMDRATKKLMHQYADQKPIVRSDFRSINAAESAKSFGPVHVNEVHLYFCAARRMQQLGTTPDRNASWGVYINTDWTKAPDHIVNVFGSENDDIGAPWKRLEEAVDRGKEAFMEPFNDGAPLSEAWQTGALAINAYLEQTHDISLAEDWYT